MQGPMGHSIESSQESVSKSHHGSGEHDTYIMEYKLQVRDLLSARFPAEQSNLSYQYALPSVVLRQLLISSFKCYSPPYWLSILQPRSRCRSAIVRRIAFRNEASPPAWSPPRCCPRLAHCENKGTIAGQLSEIRAYLALVP